MAHLYLMADRQGNFDSRIGLARMDSLRDDVAAVRRLMGVILNGQGGVRRSQGVLGETWDVTVSLTSVDQALKVEWELNNADSMHVQLEAKTTMCDGRMTTMEFAVKAGWPAGESGHNHNFGTLQDSDLVDWFGHTIGGARKMLCDSEVRIPSHLAECEAPLTVSTAALRRSVVGELSPDWQVNSRTTVAGLQVLDVVWSVVGGATMRK